MGIVEIILLGVALSMDALAVSVTSGITIKDLKPRHVLYIAFFFGGFQALMPVLGWLAGSVAVDYIRDFDHWIAFGLLAFVGGKMIYEAVTRKEEDEGRDPLKFSTLLLLAIATSIDALAVGITFSMLDAINLPLAVGLIGATTFIISAAGVCLGHYCGKIFGCKMEILGGLILIGIGVKIIWEHLAGD